MKLKSSTVILNEHPSLLIYPLLCLATLLLFIWFFPFIAIYKALTQEWLSFVPSVVKIGFVILLFYLAFQYVVSFFRIALVSAAVLCVQEKNDSLLSGFIRVFHSAKYFISWVIFDAVFFPIWDLIMKKIQEDPNQIGGETGQLAAWKLRQFSAPVMVFEKLMPYKAVDRAMEITIEKGAKNLLGDLGWEFLTLILVIIGITLPVFISWVFPASELGDYWLPILLSYFVCVWVFTAVNHAIRVAQIYAQEQ